MKTPLERLQAKAARLRARIKKVKREGAAWRAYRDALDILKQQMAALRRRPIVESPDAE